jgi:hypothetical protein
LTCSPSRSRPMAMLNPPHTCRACVVLRNFSNRAGILVVLDRSRLEHNLIIPTDSEVRRSPRDLLRVGIDVR